MEGGGWLRAEEEGSLRFDGGFDGLVPGAADSLGEEEIVDWEGEDDHFQEFRGGEGARCGGHAARV